MSQSRKMSAVESFCNQLSGILISLCVWEWIVEPLFNIEKNLCENIGITLIFFCVSSVRSFAWRRWFNKKEGDK